MSKLSGFENTLLKVKNYKCFGDVAAGFESIRPINVIIGKNNTGKSALVDLFDLASSRGKSFKERQHRRGAEHFEIVVSTILTETQLRRHFQESTSGGHLPGNHWQYGKRFLDARILKSLDERGQASLIEGITLDSVRDDTARSLSSDLASNSDWPFDGFTLIRVAAERDVVPEVRNPALSLSPNGKGTTNTIRGFINQEQYDRATVEVDLLEELNEIYSGDSEFERISCREDDNGLWEIFLEESVKGEVRLSQSGSSLQSVFIILCYLRLHSVLAGVNWGKIVFAVEEPENNLHPALLRRLLNFLARKREEHGFILVLTSHSPIGIDWASRREDSQIIHVQNVKGVASATSSSMYLEQRAILDDLDIRASDLLQANGVIWVEGPSDRIYIRKWIDLSSEGELKEGVHYSMMFYGGRLLSHLESSPPGDNRELISILGLNRNAAIVIDSDRHLGKPAVGKAKAKKPRMAINSTKKRVKDEVEAMGGYVWITEGREIENYVPRRVYELLVNKGPFEAGIYDAIPQHSYLKQFQENKVGLAHSAASALQGDDLHHLDLKERLDDLCRHIRSWNRL
ncbi:ATP-dependent nuclease [Ensifer sp. NPDC090286]|uniref:ATP-dependent nuclease n=1 Tax=Ensifer sp. NPDC090286 TaxID=3363991 RepID=UPI00383BD41C